jgi:hypothetical protein
MELLKVVDRHPQVTAIPLRATEFLDWDKLQNKMVGKVDGLLKNHIFTVQSEDSNRMVIQAYDGAMTTTQLLVKEQFQETDWATEMEQLQQLPVPGLPDIKWNELYSKWGHFIPEDRKQGLIYYSKEPPAAIKKRIAVNTAAAKQARGKRSRTTGHARETKNVPKKEPKK